MIMIFFRFKEFISKEMLEKYFFLYGEIEEIFVLKFKGYGFVIFKEVCDVEKILKIRNYNIGNVEIYVKLLLVLRYII